MEISPFGLVELGAPAKQFKSNKTDTFNQLCDGCADFQKYTPN